MCCAMLSCSVMSDSLQPQVPLSMGILQSRILEWVAMPSSRGSFQLRVQTATKLFSTMITPFCQLLKKKNTKNPILVSVKWCLNVVIICISLMTNNVKHLYMYLCIFVGVMSIQIFCSFENQIICFSLMSSKCSLYILHTRLFIRCMIC